MALGFDANSGSGREHDDDADLQELLTVEEVAALLKVSKSWCMSTRGHAGHRDPNVSRTSRWASMSVLTLARCERSSRRNAEQRDPVSRTR